MYEDSSFYSSSLRDKTDISSEREVCKICFPTTLAQLDLKIRGGCSPTNINKN